MRRLTYRVATSLDGYLAGPKGEIDWIVRDATVDFGAVFAQFDTVLLGLRAESGRDIWLFGGGNLFASLVALHLVDRIELAVMPVLLGQGISWAGTAALRSHLRLNHSDASPMGTVNLRYDVLHTAG